jgi:hypothetical protein
MMVACHYRLVSVILSCTNQFARFYAKSDARFRHSASIADKIKTTFVIEENLGRSLRQIEIYNELAQFGITDFMKHEMVKTVLGYDEITPKKDLVKKGNSSYQNHESIVFTYR